VAFEPDAGICAWNFFLVAGETCQEPFDFMQSGNFNEELEWEND
jgi:hypothetical protein